MSKQKLSARIKTFLLNNPAWSVAEVAQKFNVSRPYVYALRKKVRNAEVGEVLQQVAPEPSQPSQWTAGVDEGAGVIIATHSEPPAVDAVLDARAVEYGTFMDGAALMQALKRALAEHAQKHGKTFADDQWEALEMIVHKIGRIVNGNPDNVDSWRDIAGYAVLVADRLEGRAR